MNVKNKNLMEEINDFFSKSTLHDMLKIEYETTTASSLDDTEILRPTVYVKYYTEWQPRVDVDCKYKMICSGHTKTDIILMHLVSTLQNLSRDYHILRRENKEELESTLQRCMNK